MTATNIDNQGDGGERGSGYVVVARRYRPQSFDELIGQEPVSQALSSAIATHRVGHAYLFSGARGVGKTSTARIFAKALNCQKGPTSSPCNECDVCLGITSGGDVDVLEIDGASNRGIDEIRQLRSNVNIRPSRARFKIYIIDEVHMLTTAAFNALLKTLEEPPEHVKFMFCTTDPEKIPITVLSRCQRFDFSPVGTDAIVGRLRQIVDAEGVAATDDALRLLARRATGSMRDSQSLLEQLLSFCGERIEVQDVHDMLGTAPAGRLEALTSQLIGRNAQQALIELDRALDEGVEVGQLAEQIVGYFRDLMAAQVGCDADLMLQTDGGDFPSLLEAAAKIGLESVIAMIQILDESVVRMRQSTQPRMLLEVAFVRVCQIDQLDDLAEALAELRGRPASDRAPAAQPASSRQASGPPAVAKRPQQAADRPAAAQKKTELTEESIHSAPEVTENLVKIDEDSGADIWRQTISQFEDITSDYGSVFESAAISAPNRLVVSFGAGYTLQKEGCERPERKARIEQVLSRLAGRTMRVDFEVLGERQPDKPQAQQPSLRQRMREVEQQPMVKQAVELFDAEVTRLEEPRQKKQ